MAKKSNKGLNMEKVMEIRNEVEEVLVEESNTPVVIQEAAEHIGVSVEEVDALREMCVEETYKEMELVEKKENERMNELKIKVNNGIKYAILKGKESKEDQKYVPGKQIIAIFKSYKHIVGCEMDDAQKSYIKTLNSTQIRNIIQTLNVARKGLATA